MSKAMTHGKTNTTVRWGIAIGVLGIVAGLFAGGHLISPHHKEVAPTENTPHNPHIFRVASSNLSLTGSLFKLPISSQESLFVHAFWEDGSVLQYGTGWLAERIEEWRKADLFGDATLAKWLVRKSQEIADDENFSRPVFSEQSLPVNLTDGAFQVAVPADAPLQSVQGLRVRTQVDSSGLRQVDQVVSARQSLGSSPSLEEVIYTRGGNGRPSILWMRTALIGKASPDTNQWVVVLFQPTETQQNDKLVKLVLVGVLNGTFVSRDGTVSFSSGEAGWVRVEEKTGKVELLQRAELSVSAGELLLHWDAVESGFDPMRVQLHAVQGRLDSMEDLESGRRAIESVQTAIPLDAYELWARQTISYDPDF